LEEQSELLLRMYQAEFAKDPTSLAIESSRSNMIALRHSINQIYGAAAGLDVANAMAFRLMPAHRRVGSLRTLPLTSKTQKPTLVSERVHSSPLSGSLS
jgi:hypothetical protein